VDKDRDVDGEVMLDENEGGIEEAAEEGGTLTDGGGDDRPPYTQTPSVPSGI
jgi:hypothetical protein